MPSSWAAEVMLKALKKAAVADLSASWLPMIIILWAAAVGAPVGVTHTQTYFTCMCLCAMMLMFEMLAIGPAPPRCSC
jgi:hypothetical protein